MALEIITVGASVKYCAVGSSTSRPTSGYTKLPDVVEAPEIGLSPDTIDVSNIEDTITRYVQGIPAEKRHSRSTTPKQLLQLGKQW